MRSKELIFCWFFWTWKYYREITCNVRPSRPLRKPSG